MKRVASMRPAVRIPHPLSVVPSIKTILRLRSATGLAYSLFKKIHSIVAKITYKMCFFSKNAERGGIPFQNGVSGVYQVACVR